MVLLTLPARAHGQPACAPQQQCLVRLRRGQGRRRYHAGLLLSRSQWRGGDHRGRSALAGQTGSLPPIETKGFAKHFEPDKGWLLKSVKPIEHLALIRYLELRGIPLSLAQGHLKQVYAKNLQTGRGILALGLRNEEGGYELRNPFLKSSISPKTITFIRGAVPKPDSIHVFEGMLDFLSAAADCPEQQLGGDAIVLNSVSNLNDAVPYIKGYGYQTLHSWMDNDPAGEKARQALYKLARNEPDLLHQPKNALYALHGDVNAWRMHRLGLHPIAPIKAA